MHPSPFAPSRRAPFRSLVVTFILATSLLVALASRSPHARAAPAAPPPPNAHDFTDPIFSADARGDITTIGNVTTTCDPNYHNDRWSVAESRAACNGSLDGTIPVHDFAGHTMPPVNNKLSMRFVDVDRDPTTFSSSTATLAVPTGATVLWAGLHWNAAVRVPISNAGHGSAFFQPPPSIQDQFRVRMSTPASAGYLPVDATSSNGTTTDTWTDSGVSGATVSYGGFVDVTDQVRHGGSGVYGVADVQACTGFGGCFGSWSLTVAYASADLPPRNLNVWHGWKLTAPSVHNGTQVFDVAGITPPPNGPVSAHIGVVQADGDRGLGPDSLDISSPSHPAWKTFQTVDRPLNPTEGDWFNSTSNSYGTRTSGAGANPNLLANLNQDIAIVDDDEVIGNHDASARFRVKTAGTESLYSQVVHAAVEIHAPQIALDKSVDPAQPLIRGQEVTWTLRARNAGIDPIRRATIVDPFPDGLDLVPGSIEVTHGPASELGSKTDAIGDDEVEWDPQSRTLTARIGTGADGNDGGTMDVAPAMDDSDEVVVTFRTTVTGDPDRAITNDARATGVGRELDDPFGPLTTDDDDAAEVRLAPSSDLGIAKSDHGAQIRAVGDRITYDLLATNAGPSPATGVTITDVLDERLRFVESPDGCTVDGQAVRCVVGELDAGATTNRRIVVAVRALPAPGRSIPNVATIAGDQPNPDCDEITPHARCNHDDEQTPRIADPVPTTTTRTTMPGTTTVPGDPPPPPVYDDTIVRTGADVRLLVGIGVALVGAGAAIVGIERRRRRRPDIW